MTETLKLTKKLKCFDSNLLLYYLKWKQYKGMTSNFCNIIAKTVWIRIPDIPNPDTFEIRTMYSITVMECIQRPQPIDNT